MDKILANTQCKLGEESLAYYYESVYGVKCTNNNSKWLELLYWAYNSTCIPKEVNCKHCSEQKCLFCNLQSNIGKLIKHCTDCKPKKYKEPIVIPNSDYSCWYSSQEYLDCLAIQLEENGWIDSAINLCSTLHPEITISSADLCDAITLQLSAQCLDCFEVSESQFNLAFNHVLNNLINT